MSELDHAEHFDPNCEECAYLARPTRETLTTTRADRAPATPDRADPERRAEGLLREAADAVIAHWAGEHINSERTCSMQDDIDNLAALVGRPRAWPALTPPPAGNELEEGK